MIYWGLLLWSLIGAVATATIERKDDGWIIHWEFFPGEPLRIFAAGPLMWIMIVMRGSP